jgi:VWFA-related protein
VASAQQPSFKAGVELVRLDVQVVDDDGRPVRDLKQDEIEVVEGGEARPVLLFQHVEEPLESYRDVERRTVASEVSTNQGAARGHLYVLVFDQQHILPGHEQRARLAAQRFLDHHLRPGDRAAVYAFPGPGLQTGFTNDGPHLARALSAVRGIAEAQQAGVLGTMSLQEAFQIVRGDELTLRAVTQRLQQNAPSTDVAGRMRSEDDSRFVDSVREDARSITKNADAESRRMLSMLVDVLRPMRAIEGRKTVLLFSEGFNGDALRRDIDEVAAAAARSYSTIDAIDLSRRTGDAVRDVPSTTDPSIGIADAMSPLGTLAAETNGRLVLDANDRLDDVLAGIADRSQDYYLVGFTPREAAPKDPGVYRPVSVRVRRRGAHVSARTGFAFDDGSAKLTRRDAIDRALAAPFPQQALPVRYTTYVMRGSATGMQKVVLSLEADLPIASAQQARPADVVFVVRFVADGRVAASGTDVIRLPDRAEQGATVGRGRYQVQFELAAGDYVMRAVVREPDGLAGSADRRFTVAALDAPTVTATDLVVSDATGSLPVRPTAFTRDGLTGVLELYGRTGEQVGAARVTFDLVAAGDTSPIVSTSAVLDEIRPLVHGAARTAHLDLPLGTVAPGAYVARATVKVGADTVAESDREVEIHAGARPAADAASAADAFDPVEIATAAFARDYLAALAEARSPALADARRGLDRFRAGDFPAAIAALQAGLAADARNGATAFFLGWAFHGAGDDRDAISAWRRAAFIDPTLVPVHLALADMYVRLSQPALAAQALRAGLAAIPDSPALRERLARVEGK